MGFFVSWAMQRAIKCSQFEDHRHTEVNSVLTTNMSSSSVLLPDFSGYWPIRTYTNPNATPELIDEAQTWVHSYSPFSQHALSAFFKGKFAEFATMTYPKLDGPALRLAIDNLFIFFIIDEHTDDKDSVTVRKQCDEIIYAFKWVSFILRQVFFFC